MCLNAARTTLEPELRLAPPGSETREHVLAHAAQSLACALTFETFLTTGSLGARPTLGAEGGSPLSPL